MNKPTKIHSFTSFDNDYLTTRIESSDYDSTIRVFVWGNGIRVNSIVTEADVNYSAMMYHNDKMFDNANNALDWFNAEHRFILNNYYNVTNI